MFQWIARQVVTRRLAVLLAAGAFAVVGILWGTSAFGRLAAGGFDDPGSQSTLAAQRIGAELGQHAPDVLVRYSSRSATVDAPAFRDAVRGVESRLRATPAVSEVTGYYDGADKRFVSADRHATYIAVQLTAADDSQRRGAFETIKQDLTAPGLTAQVGGDVAVQAAGDDVTKRDVARGEMFALPVVLVLLAVIFGSVVAALMPLLVGIVAILGALTATRAIESVTTVSTFAINTITLLGLGMAIDYALIVINRYREQLRLGDSPQEAARHTILTAGRTVVISGLTVTLSLASMLVFPEVFLHSMAFGGMSAVFIAMVTSLTVLPAALAMLGHRVNALPVRRRAIAVLRTGSEDDGAWARIARAVMRRPASYAAAVVVVLAVLSLPVLHLRFGGFDERVLPADSGPRVAAGALARDFPGLASSPIEVLAEGAGPAQLAHLAGAIRGLPGAPSVTVTVVRAGHALLDVAYQGEPAAAPTQALVGDIRALPAPAGVSVLVAGPPAELADQLHSLAAGLPWMLLVMAGVTLVLLFLAFGSVVLPVKAVLVNVAVSRRGVRRPGLGIPVRAPVRAPALHRDAVPGADHPGACARAAVRARHRLRGLPALPCPRGMAAPGRQRGGGGRGPAAHRRAHHRGRAAARRGDGRLRQRSARHRQADRRRHGHRPGPGRGPCPYDPGARDDAAARPLELVAAGAARRGPPPPGTGGGELSPRRRRSRAGS